MAPEGAAVSDEVVGRWNARFTEIICQSSYSMLPHVRAVLRIQKYMRSEIPPSTHHNYADDEVVLSIATASA